MKRITTVILVSYIGIVPSYRSTKARCKKKTLSKIQHLKHSETNHCAIELGVSLGDKTVELNSLNSYLILMGEASLPTELSNLKLVIESEPDKDGRAHGIYKFRLEDKDGALIEQTYISKLPWDALGIRAKALSNNLGSTVHQRKDEDDLVLIDHFKLKITYFQGTLFYEDELGSGVWYENRFISEEQYKLIRKVKQENELATSFLRKISHVLTLAQANPQRLIHTIDQEVLSKILWFVAQLISKNSNKISAEIAKPQLRNGKKFIEEMTASPARLHQLAIDWKKLKGLLENIYHGKIERKTTIEEALASLPLNDPTNDVAQVLQAKETGRIWRYSQDFNDAITDFCSTILDQSLDKQLVSLKTPVKKRTFGDFYHRVIFECRKANKPVLQLVRNLWQDPLSPLDLVIRDYKDSNFIYRWITLSKCSPHEYSFTTINDYIVFLSGNYPKETRFTLKSISIQDTLDSAIRNLTIKEPQEVPIENSQICCSVSSHNSHLVVAFQNKTVVQYSLQKEEGCLIISSSMPIDLSLNPNARDPMYAFHQFNKDSLAICMFNEVYFSLYFYDFSLDLPAKKVHESTFDSLLTQGQIPRPKSFGFIGENQYRYPIIIGHYHGCVVLLPYKLMMFDLLFITNRGEVVLMHSHNDEDSVLRCVQRPLPLLAGKKKADGNETPSCLTYFERDLDNRNIINIVCVDYSRTVNVSSGVDIIRCILRL